MDGVEEGREGQPQRAGTLIYTTAAHTVHSSQLTSSRLTAVSRPKEGSKRGGGRFPVTGAKRPLHHRSQRASSQLGGETGVGEAAGKEAKDQSLIPVSSGSWSPSNKHQTTAYLGSQSLLVELQRRVLSCGVLPCTQVTGDEIPGLLLEEERTNKQACGRLTPEPWTVVTYVMVLAHVSVRGAALGAVFTTTETTTITSPMLADFQTLVTMSFAASDQGIRGLWFHVTSQRDALRSWFRWTSSRVP